MQAAVNQIPSLNFKIWRHRQNRVMAAPHSHADIELNLLFRGHMRYLFAGREVILQPNAALLFWAGVPHQTIQSERHNDGIWMTLPLSWLLRRQGLSPLQARLMSGLPIILSPETDLVRLLPRWLEDFMQDNSPRYEAMGLEIEAACLRLSSELPKSVQPVITTGDPTVQRVCEYLSTQYQGPLTAESVARHVRLHPKYLLARFRKITGVTFWNYLTQLRVAHAQRLLLQESTKALDVGLECGFQSNSAFYAAFKKHTGLTPNQFRKAQKPS